MPEAFDALWQLARAGLQLIPVTGRPMGWVEVVARQWPVHAAVGENGGGWIWQKEGGWQCNYHLGTDALDSMQAQLQELDRQLKARFDWLRPTADQWARRCDLAYDIGESWQCPQVQVQALGEAIVEAGAEVSLSSVHMHAALGRWDKAQGCVRALADALQCDLNAERERWIYIGDSGNDAPAFEYFPTSIGVANVRARLDSIAHPPRFVTQAERGEGFAEMAKTLLRYRSEQS